MEESMNRHEITFAYQSWNDDLNWYNPNGHPKDWMINGVKTVPYTHGGQFFKWESINYDYNLINTMTYEELIAMGAEPTKQEYLDWFVKFKLLDDIPYGEKYIYNINVSAIGYFLENEQFGFDFIAPRVIEDVKNNIAKIVIIFPYEGNTGLVQGEQGSHVNRGASIVNEWCKRAGLHKNQVYFVHGNLLADEFNSIVTNYTSMSVDTFSTWLPREYMNAETNPPVYNPVDDKNLYLCYNRNVKTNRIILMTMLEHKNIFDRGLISCGSPITIEHLRYQIERYNLEHLSSAAERIANKTPIEIDMNLTTNNPACNIVEDHYRKTFISLIPETHYDDGILFRSEKIWKTLAVGHPFIVFSCSGFLKSLKELGFKTFDKWIDESYDNEPDWIKRSDMVTDEVNRLSTFSIDQMHGMRREMESAVLHNKQLCKSIYLRDMSHNGSGPLGRRMEQIWNSF